VGEEGRRAKHKGGSDRGVKAAGNWRAAAHAHHRMSINNALARLRGLSCRAPRTSSSCTHGAAQQLRAQRAAWRNGIRA